MKDESIEDIVHELRNEWATLYFSEGSRTRNGEYPNTVCVETDVLADRIEAALQREKAKIEADVIEQVLLNDAARDAIKPVFDQPKLNQEELK